MIEIIFDIAVSIVAGFALVLSIKNLNDLDNLSCKITSLDRINFWKEKMRAQEITAMCLRLDILEAERGPAEMSNEEAIDILETLMGVVDINGDGDRCDDAFKAAIKALKREENNDKQK